MKIVAINTDSPNYPRFLEFVTGHRLLFHSEAWLKVYEPGKIVQCAILNKNEEIIGCFIYYRFSKFGFRCIISPPFTPDISLFYINPSESVVGKNSFHKDLLNVLADYFDGLKVSYLHINLPDHIVDTQPFIWKKYLSRNRYSYLIDLSVTKDNLWDTLSSEKRKSLNKAVKDELSIKETTDPELIFSLVSQSLERNELHSNRQIIRNIIFSFAGTDKAIAFAAHHNGQALGVAFCLVSQNKALYLFGGFDAGNKHHGAGVSCMWNCILRSKEHGLAYFDFEGSMRPAIERYFREFGGKLTPYFNVEKVRPAMKILLALKQHNPI